MTTAVLTPHIDASLTLSAPDLEARLTSVDHARRQLREEWQRLGGRLRILDGFEIALDRPDVMLDDPRLRLAGTNYLLVEWPGMRLPHADASVRVLERLSEDGWLPVLAHPERYSGMADHLWVLDAWRSVGAHLQVNVGSILGMHGRIAYDIAMHLLHGGKADLLASDYHGWPVRPPGLLETADWFSQRQQALIFERLMVDNPARLIEGKALLEVPELPDDPSLVERMRRGWVRRIKKRR